MDPNRVPAPDVEHVQPNPDQAAPPPYNTPAFPALPPPPPFRPTARRPEAPDWILLIPSYHKYLYAKLSLAAAAVAVSVAVVVLAKTFGDRLSEYRNPVAYLHSDSITYGAALLAIIWVLFEFMVVFIFTGGQPQRRGIHPGGHVLFYLTIWILALYATIEDVNYLKARGRRRDNLFLSDTPRSAKLELDCLQKSLLGCIVALLALAFVLFCRACWETWQVNSGKHAPQTIRLDTIPPQQPVLRQTVSKYPGPQQPFLQQPIPKYTGPQLPDLQQQPGMPRTGSQFSNGQVTYQPLPPEFSASGAVPQIAPRYT